MAQKGDDMPPASLVCPICQELFKDATLLSCGHTYCKECLQNLDRSLSKHGAASYILCPLCRSKTKLSKKRIGTLSRNVSVNSLVDDFKQMKVKEAKSRQPLTVALTSSSAHTSRAPLPVAWSASGGDADNGYAEMRNPVAQPRRALLIIKEINLLGGMRGMAAVSPDKVVVGYGSSQPGAESFAINGERKQFLGGDVGPVRDIAIMSNGFRVVSHGPDVLRIYNIAGFPTSFQFDSCKANSNHYSICTDKQDNVYAVNGNQEIYKFSKEKTTPVKVISTGTAQPSQISIATNGTIIITSREDFRSTVSLIDNQGNIAVAVKASRTDEFLYATVDKLDRVFVACVRPKTGALSLGIYTIQGLTLVAQARFQELKLAPTSGIWYYIACVTPNILAIANIGMKLYFVQVPDVTHLSHNPNALMYGRV